jgi:NADPH:quinone reductase
MRGALDLLARGEVRVEVADILPLEDAAEAHRRIERRATTGKLVLRVDR